MWPTRPSRWIAGKKIGPGILRLTALADAELRHRRRVPQPEDGRLSGLAVVPRRSKRRLEPTQRATETGGKFRVAID